MVRTVRFETGKGKKEVRAVGYVRVSTTDQAREGKSLDAQERTIREHCKEKGYRLLKGRIYRDEGKSAYRGQKRVGHRNVMADVENERCDIVVVYSLSRFSRNTLQLLNNLEAMKKRNVDFVSISEQFMDTTSPVGWALLQIIATIAQLESAQTGERVKTVLKHKASNGEYCGGSAPMGYELIKKVVKTYQGNELKVVPPYFRKLPKEHRDRKIVEEIFRLYGRGVPMQKIEQSEKVKKHRATVLSILSNPAYTGLMVFEPGDKAKIHKGKFEPYISITTFNANQNRRSKNNFNRRTKNEKYTLHKAKGLYYCRVIPRLSGSHLP